MLSISARQPRAHAHASSSPRRSAPRRVTRYFLARCACVLAHIKAQTEYVYCFRTTFHQSITTGGYGIVIRHQRRSQHISDMQCHAALSPPPEMIHQMAESRSPMPEPHQLPILLLASLIIGAFKPS